MTCKLITKEQSKLYFDLKKLFNDNNLNNGEFRSAYFAFSSPAFINMAKGLIDLDEHSEPTLESLNKIFGNITTYFKKAYDNVFEEKVKSGVIDKDGNEIIYDNYEEALSISLAYNRLNTMYMSRIENKNGQYIIKFYERNNKNISEEVKVIYNIALHKAIILRLTNGGFNINNIEKYKSEEYFNPLNAFETIKNIIKDLNVLNNQPKDNKNLHGVSELFLNIIFDTFQDNNLLKRLLSRLDEETMREILTDEEYNKFSDIDQRKRFALIKYLQKTSILNYVEDKLSGYTINTSSYNNNSWIKLLKDYNANVIQYSNKEESTSTQIKNTKSTPLLIQEATLIFNELYLRDNYTAITNETILSTILKVKDSKSVIIAGEIVDAGTDILIKTDTLKLKTLSIKGFLALSLLAAIKFGNKNIFVFNTKDNKWYTYSKNLGKLIPYDGIILLNEKTSIDVNSNDKNNKQVITALENVIKNTIQKKPLIQEKKDNILNLDPKGELIANIVKNLLLMLHKADLTTSSAITLMDQAAMFAGNVSSNINDEFIDDTILSDISLDTSAVNELGYKLSQMELLLKKGIGIIDKKLHIKMDPTKDIVSNTYETAKTLRANYIRQNYALGCVSFLNGCINEGKLIKEQLEKLNIKSNDVYKNINKLAKIALTIDQYNSAYTLIVSDMTRIRDIANEDGILLDDTVALKIEKLSIDTNRMIGELNQAGYKLKNQLVFSMLMEVLEQEGLYTVKFGKNKGDIITILMIMDNAKRDASFLERFVKSLGDSSDDIMRAYYTIVKNKKDEITQQVVDFNQEISVLNDKLAESGYDSSFMIERDSEGKKTGNLISIIEDRNGNLYNIDFIQYYKDRYEYRKSLNDLNISFSEKMKLMDKWEEENTTEIHVVKGYSRKEKLPSGKYLKPNKYHLSKPLLDFYFAMIKRKAMLDDLLNSKATSTFRAIQRQDDFLGNITDSKDRHNAIKNIKSRLKDNFTILDYDIAYGGNIALIHGYFNSKTEKFYKSYDLNTNTYKDEISLRKNEIYIDDATNRLYNFDGKNLNIYNGYSGLMLDFSGNPICRVPTYYLKRLDNMERLSTDVTSSMMAYAGMAINYKMMSDNIYAYEMMTLFINERKVNHMNKDNPLVEAFKSVNGEYMLAYTTLGKESTIGLILRTFNEALLYGVYKKNETLSKAGDTLKNISTVTAMGVNPFAGLANEIGGVLLQLIHATGGRFFSFKNLLKGRLKYDSLVSEYVAKDLHNKTKTTKLGLFINMFDPMLDLFELSTGERVYKNRVQRLFGNGTFLFLNSMGEHHLHCTTMFAMMDKVNFILDGKTVTMYDIFEVLQDKNKKVELVIKDGVIDKNEKQLFTKSLQEELLNLKQKEDLTDLEISRIKELNEIREYTNKLFTKFKNKLHKTNGILFGLYNLIDRGEMNMYCFGRLFGQFRQWMPAMYENRFGKAKLDFLLDEQTEGFYRTTLRFLLHDIKKAKFNVAMAWRNLSEEEKQNIYRASREVGILVGLVVSCSLMKAPEDKDGSALKMLKYQLLRMKLEIGAMVPSTMFLKNITTLVKSPIPAINNFNDMISIIEFQNIFKEIESGRYKGLNLYLHNVSRFFLGPYRNIERTLDLKDENYMFLIFNQ